MIDQASVPSLMGSTVRDNAGEKIGKVGQVYLDDTTGQPEWVTVRTGLFGTKESFVPLAAARVEGDELVVDIAKDRVSDAPKIDEDGHLSEEQETELYQYYGVSQGPFGRQTTPTAGGGPADAAVVGDPADSTYAGTETGRTGEGYPETDAGADYATTGVADAPTTAYPASDAAAAEAPAAAAYPASDAAAADAYPADAPAGERATGTPAYETGAPAAVAPAYETTESADAPGYGTTDAATGVAAGAPDYAATDAATGVAPTTDYANTDAATGVAQTPDHANTDAATGVAQTAGRTDGLPVTDRPYEPAAGLPADRVGAVGEPADRTGDLGDPTGTPVGDADVSDAFSGPGYGDVDQPDVAEAGPDFARGEDGSVTSGEIESGPDFARGEDTSGTAEESTAGPDYARGEDRSTTYTEGTIDETETATPAPHKSRLRRWLSSDEPAATDGDR